MTHARLILLLTTLLMAAARTHAQCDFTWLSGGAQPGIGGEVGSIVEWDPDGEGPSSAWTVIAGTIRFPGTSQLPRVAAWDGQSWLSLRGNLLSTPPAGLAVYDGQLLAYGSVALQGFPGFPTLIRWNGLGWEPFGPPLGHVRSVQVYQEQLIVLGWLQAQGQETGAVVWDGTAWALLPDNACRNALTATIANGEMVVWALEYEEDGSSGAALAAWNGASWRRLISKGQLVQLSLLQGIGDILYVYGSFNAIDGVPAESIAMLDANGWHSMGNPFHSGSSAIAFGSHEGQLYVGGNFHDFAHNPAIDKLARWDGSQWQPVGVVGASVTAIASTSHGLAIGGQFETLDRRPAWRVGLRQDSAWTAMPDTGVADEVNVFTLHEGILYAGCGTATHGRVASWNGASWAPVGGHFNGTVGALESFDGAVYAGGAFTKLDGEDMFRLARWDGADWTSPEQGITDGEVAALRVYNASLIVGGTFTSIGDDPMPRVAAWNGSQWTPMAEGLPGAVRSLATYAGKLVAGGDFLFSTTPRVGGVALWDGSSWSPVGTGWEGARAIVEFNGQLLAGSTNGVGRWDGNTWQPFGAGNSGDIRSLAVFNGQVFAGGAPLRINNVNVNQLASWDGTTWTGVPVSLGGESTLRVKALAVKDGQLFLGGNFYSLQDAPSAFVVRYGLASGSTADCNANGIFDECDLADGGGSDDNNGDGIPDECQSFAIGDMNCNGVINVADIAGFVLALTDPAGYAAQFPSCDILNADCNSNGVINVADIGAFVQLLTGGQ